MSFSVRNSNNFSLNDLESNALYLQPLAAGYRSGSTTAANGANTIVLDASLGPIPGAYASNATQGFFVHQMRVSTEANAVLRYNTDTKEINWVIIPN